MVVLATPPVLSDADISAAHEISAYCAAGIPLSKEIAVAVRYIVERYPRPASAASEPTRSTYRSRDVKPLEYPPEWIDGFTFRKAVRAFWSAILSLRQSNAYQKHATTRPLSGPEAFASTSNKDSLTPPTVTMDQAGKQPAPRSMEDRMTGMKRLLERLAARLEVAAPGETRSPGTPGTPAEPATTTPSRDGWNPAKDL